MKTLSLTILLCFLQYGCTTTQYDKWTDPQLSRIITHYAGDETKMYQSMGAIRMSNCAIFFYDIETESPVWLSGTIEIEL